MNSQPLHAPTSNSTLCDALEPPVQIRTSAPVHAVGGLAHALKNGIQSGFLSVIQLCVPTHRSLSTVLQEWLDQLPDTQRAEGETWVRTLLTENPKTSLLKIRWKYATALPNISPFFKRLETLDLFCCARTLPEWIFNLKNLQKLHVNAPMLEQFPEHMPPLPKLRSFELHSCNALSELPEAISRFTTLTHMALYNCPKLNKLPDTLGNLQKLETLEMSNNLWLEALPESIGQLQHLKKLTFEQCFSLKDIPESIGGLLNLQELHLAACDLLQTLPVSIGLLRNLRKLSLHKCRSLRRLPETLGELSQLNRLNVSRCSTLACLPNSIVRLENLVKLNASYCPQLTSLPENILSLPGFCQVDLHSTGLSHAIVQHLQRQTEVLISQNQSPPRLDFSILSESTLDIGTLKDELQKWHDEAEQPALNATEMAHINDLPETEANALATLIARLRHTAVYLRQRAATVKRVHSLFNTVVNTPKILSACCAMATESTETCDDRTALGLLYIELIVKEFTVLDNARKAPTPPAAYQHVQQAAPGIFKQRKLMDIAHAHAKRLRGVVDETEIVLKYITALGKELQLPAQLDHMLFAEHGWQVNADSLDQARKQFEQHTNTEHLNFLAKWPVFRETVEHHQPKEYHHLQQEQAGIAHEYRERLKPLQKAYRAALNTVGEAHEDTLNLLIEIKLLSGEQNQAILQPWHTFITQTIT